MPLLEETLRQIRPLDREAMAVARHHQNNLTKPLDSLGRLEEIAVQIAGITGDPFFKIEGKAIIVAAADHGITEEGVSAYPSEVTAQMVANFLGGGAAINVLARHVGARVVIVDAGVAGDLLGLPNLVVRKARAGTANMAQGPAMTREEAHASVEAGITLASEEIERGAGIIATGDMGIGNTSAAAAILSTFTARPASETVGAGTGVVDEALAKKVAAVQRALDTNQPDADDPLDVLAKVGGLEIGVLAGVILGTVAQHRPVALDGFISGAAALIASGFSARSMEYVFACHRSAEQGHALLLSHLELTPLLDLGMRLGEGTGAALGMSIIEAASRCQTEMATFSQANVSGSTD